MAAFLDARHYLPKDVPLLKAGVALPGRMVCRIDRSVSVDGMALGAALTRDHLGRPTHQKRLRRHGVRRRTLLSSAMTGKVSPYKKGLGPFPGEIYHLPLPSETTGVSLDDTTKALNFLFAADIEPERIAAIILEPVQGEGGFHAPDPDLYWLIDEVRKKYGIVLIADEVQTGLARTVACSGSSTRR